VDIIIKFCPYELEGNAHVYRLSNQ